MFGLKTRVRQQAANYLRVIRPWAMGVNNRGWVREDFYENDPALGGFDGSKKDTYDYRTDPTHVIFPLTPYHMDWLDRLFMEPRLYEAMLNLNQGISNFNAMLAVFTTAQTAELRWHTAVMLHTGLIGTVNTGGLYDRWMIASQRIVDDVTKSRDIHDDYIGI